MSRRKNEWDEEAIAGCGVVTFGCVFILFKLGLTGFLVYALIRLFMHLGIF